MQVKETRKSYIDLYTSSIIIIVVVDCQKTANSRLTFPWYNACSITLTDFFSSHRAERPSFSIRKECQLLLFIILKILFAFLM